MSSYFLRRNRRMMVGESNAPTIDSFVTAWAQRVVSNGGTLPSITTQTALTAFYQSLITNNLLNQMIAVNCFVPDNLTACLTPLIQGGGPSMWVNHNFVAGNLSTNGLQGDGSSKYLDTGINMSTNMPSANNSGYTIYTTGLTSGNYMQLGAYDGTNFLGGHLRNPGLGGAICDNGNYIGGTYIAGGYFSCNRISSTNLAMYFGNSTNAHAQSGATGTSANSSVLPNDNMRIFCFFLGGSPFWYTPDPLNFIALHAGLTSTQSSTFFIFVQALRTALGGYV